MRGVQNAPPENPYSFALHIKEWNNCKPPVLILLCHEVQTFARELDHSCGKRLRGAVLREDLVRRHFRQAQKLAKEPALRQELVLDDLPHRAGTLMWFERKIFFREFVPDGIELVYLTRIG